MLEIPTNLIISLLAAAITNAIQLTVFIVLYKTLKALRIQNENHQEYFNSQMNIERNSLTFRFADWIASEVKYYSPLYTKNQTREYVLTKEQIDKHLISIALKVIEMSKTKTVDLDVMKDEIQRLVLTLENMPHNTDHKIGDMILDLKKLL